MGNDHALGRAGGPGGVDHIGDVVPPQPTRPIPLPPPPPAPPPPRPPPPPPSDPRHPAAPSPSTTATPGPAIPAARPPCVTTTATPASATIHASRSRGYVGSSGTYAPPALRIPRSPTTSSGDRSTHSPTSLS